MGERVWYDVPLGLPLQPIIPDSRGSLQSLVNVAGVEKFVLLLWSVCPDPGEAIGLQFDAHLECVWFYLACRRLLGLHHLWKNTKLVLHMMPDLMRDDISLGELAGVTVRAATELVLKVFEKSDIEIDTLVTRAIERAHGGPRECARGRLSPGK